MRHVPLALLGSVFSAALLSACNTVPEPEPEPIVIEAPPLRTCTDISALTRVVIPAVTKTFTAITEIDNAPYDPIQKKETIVREVEPERVIFVNSNNVEVTDICDVELNPSGMSTEQ